MKKTSKKAAYDRGREIHYDRVPDDVFEKIQLMVLEIKKQTGRAQVGMSEAITKLVRGGCI